MELTILIDQQRCIEWKINLTEGSLMHILSKLSTWAKPVVVDGETYYFISRNKIITELPIITDKSDTIYKLLNKLDGMGLISYKKFDGKDLVRLTEVGRKWNNRDDSEKNPSVGKKSSEVGKKSENRSEKNPTYQNTIKDQKLNDPVQEISIFSENLELKNQAPQVKAKTLENDSSAPPPLSVQNTQTISDDEFVNLEKDEYKRELERWLRKNHSKFTRNKEELEYHLDNAWKNDFKFDDTRGSIMGGEKFFTYSKKFYEDQLARKPKAPDKTQIRKAARELFEKCKANWKDPYRTYPAHLQIQIDMKGIKNVEEIEIDAIEKVLSGNNPKNATLLYEMYNKMSAQVYDYMKCEWGMFIKKEKEVMKILTDEYYSLRLFHVEGWPKQ